MTIQYRIQQLNLSPDRNQLLRSGGEYLLILIQQESLLANIHQKKYLCSASEMILMKPGETLILEAVGETAEDCPYLLIRFSRDTLKALSDESIDLPEKFEFVPYDIQIIHSELRTTSYLRNFLTRISAIEEEEIAVGKELYQKSLLTVFLIHFLRACVESDRIYRQHMKKELIIDDVFRYISRHLEDDLSLTALEKVFYVSGEHLSRKFKKSTGMSLHSYIVKSRINLSKKYLLQRYSVRDVCQRCGFESYNHFFRIFKKECGMTPMEYVKSVE